MLLLSQKSLAMKKDCKPKETKRIVKQCDYCKSMVTKDEYDTHIAKCPKRLKNIKKIEKEVKKANKSQKPPPYKDAPIYKPVEITATIKMPEMEKNIKELDGSYGYHEFRERGRYGSHPSHDNNDEGSDP
jgi:Fe-S-cluster-containing dehydrogenase component